MNYSEKLSRTNYNVRFYELLQSATRKVIKMFDHCQAVLIPPPELLLRWNTYSTVTSSNHEFVEPGAWPNRQLFRYYSSALLLYGLLKNACWWYQDAISASDPVSKINFVDFKVFKVFGLQGAVGIVNFMPCGIFLRLIIWNNFHIESIN